MTEDMLTDEQADRAVGLLGASLTRANVVSINGLIMDKRRGGKKIGVVFVTNTLKLTGAGLDMELGSGMYGYGREDDDNGFYSLLPEITLIKTPDPAIEEGDEEDDPYPEYSTVWEVTTERLTAQLEDGTTTALTFPRVFAAVAIAHARQDGREDDAELLERWHMKAASEFEVANVAPALTKVTPRTTYWPTDKATHSLTDPDVFTEGGWPLEVGRKKGQMTINFSLAYDAGIVTTSRELDSVDREVVSAVTSLREAARRGTGEPVVSAYTIAKTMGIPNPDKEQCRDIDARMRDLMSVTCTIDFTEEAQKRKLVNPETGQLFTKAKIVRHVVPADLFEGVDENGNEYVRYRLASDPPTYEHAKLIGQVVTWPQRVERLAPLREDGTRYRRHNTDRQRAVKKAILERVYSLKNRKSHYSNVILYQTLCEATGVDPDNRSVKKRVVDFTEAYLRALQRDGVIVDFQPETEGSSHAKTGVRVFVKRG